MKSYKPSFPFKDLPVSLPTASIPEHAPLDGLDKWVTNALTNNLDIQHLDAKAVWRDWLSVTGSVKTFNGAATIARIWNGSQNAAFDFHAEPAKVFRRDNGVAWVGLRIRFKTKTPSGLEGPSNGWVLLVPNNQESNQESAHQSNQGGCEGKNDWKIWMITTLLEHFEGHGHPNVIPPERLQTTGVSAVDDSAVLNFSTVIIGAGQCGLSLAGRLAALGIDYILLERQPEVGYAWWGRYDTMKQHTVKEYNNLPLGRTWTEEDPMLLPGAKVVDGFKKYVEKNRINVWRSAHTESCHWEPKEQHWTLTVRVGSPPETKVCTLRARHLCLCLGGGLSAPLAPDIAGVSAFKGDQMHSEQFKNSRRWKGKRGIVIGTGTTGHDVAQDMLDNGLSSVTLIQRGRTAVFPVEWVVDSQSAFYNMKMPSEAVDDLLGVYPTKIARDLNQMDFQKRAQDEHERFDALEKVGFRVDRDAVLAESLLTRFGGFYIDIGTSARVANGEIKVKSGVPIRKFTPQGLEFEDGSELEADVVIYATGYDLDYRNQVGTIIGREIADSLEPFWGIDENGDIRGMMKQVYPGLWMVSGGAMQARFFSRFIALQIQEDHHNLLQRQQEQKEPHHVS